MASPLRDTSLFIIEDLPTLDLPEKTISGLSDGINCEGIYADISNAAAADALLNSEILSIKAVSSKILGVDKLILVRLLPDDRCYIIV